MNHERPVTDLKDIYSGQTLYVLGSGPSLDYYPPDFFRDRPAIGCNSVYTRFPVRFTVAKELPLEGLRASAAAAAFPVVSRHSYGNKNYPPPVRDLDTLHYVFDHPPNRHTGADWEVIGTDQIIVSYSTITSAIHLAAYMGAKTIFLCGCEAGTLDGQINFTGYPGTPPPDKEAWYRDWLPQIRAQTITLRDKLQHVYGCHIMTISPFVNFAHEGHIFQ